MNTERKIHCRRVDRQTYRHRHKQRECGRETGRQTDRQADLHTHTSFYSLYPLPTLSTSTSCSINSLKQFRSQYKRRASNKAFLSKIFHSSSERRAETGKTTIDLRKLNRDWGIHNRSSNTELRLGNPQ